MAAATPGNDKDIRIRAQDAMRRLESGQPVLVLDARSPKAWDSDTLKIQGAIRVDPHNLEVGPDCPRDRFTLAYCT